MKHFSNYLLLLIVLILSGNLLFQSCIKDRIGPNYSEKSIQNDVALVGENEVQPRSFDSNFTSFNIPFPEETVFEIVDSELRFTLPEPYYIVGIDSAGNYYRSAVAGTGGIRCKCTEGSGCNPVKSGEDYGCLMTDGCSKCEKSTASIIGVGEELVEIAIFNPDFPLFVEGFSDLEGKYLLQSDFIEYPEVSDFLAELEDNFLESFTDEKKIIFINVYGYILPIEIPADIDNTSVAFVSGGEVCTGRIVNPEGEFRNFVAKDGAISLTE